MKSYFHHPLKALFVIVATLLITSCKEDGTLSDEIMQKFMTVDFNLDSVKDMGLDDMYMFIFNSDEELTTYKYFDNVDNLATLDYSDMDIEEGKNTIITLFNVGEGFVDDHLGHFTKATEIGNISLLEIINIVNTLFESGELPDMLTGSATIEGDGLKYNISIELFNQPVTIGVKLVDVLLSYPEQAYLPYPQLRSKSSEEEPQLRLLAEIATPGSGISLRIGSFLGTPTHDNTFRYVVSLPTNGAYQLKLWSDYTTDPNADLYYNTADMKSIQVAETADYCANTPYKDAFAGYLESFMVDDTQTPQAFEVEMHRPVALYNIVATDLDEYNQSREEEGLPALEDLRVEVTYIGSFPTGYDLTQPALNNSATGYGYAGAPTYNASQDLVISSDYVLTGVEGSSVIVNIDIVNVTGAVISSIKGVEINYKANHVTTISGDFLTAGVRGNGVEIETEWEGEHYVEF